MYFLERDRALLERVAPGLDAQLAEAGLAVLEQPGSPGPVLLKKSGAVGLVIPEVHGGHGLRLVDAIRVQRAVGSRSPSLAVASTMHHFSVAGLVLACEQGDPYGWLLLEAIARDGLLVASGFAEGVPGGSILSPSLRATPDGTGVVISGSKKPCSLSRSMDLLTASVAVDDGMAIALVPADAPGLARRPFWGSRVLAGAESDEVVLVDVHVPRELIVPTGTDADGRLDELQTAGFVWFELLISAAYLGAASALAERMTGLARAEVFGRLEAAMSCLEGVAAAVDGEASLVAALNSRYAVQDAIDTAVPRALEALGGMAFVSSDEVSYLAATTAALKFHPPSRARMAQPLSDWYDGAPLRIV